MKGRKYMGAWGPGLYQDDVTLDVKDEYLNWLRIGKTNEEATIEVINRNLDFIQDEYDGPLFWFALADTQWKYGRLLPEIKEQALKCIENGTDLQRWSEDQKQYRKRKETLELLEKRLNSPQPPEKKVSKLSVSKAQWNVGDVLVYQIKNPEISNHRWYHKYVLFKVIGIAQFNIGSLPREYSNEHVIVVPYNWIGDEIPDEKILKKKGIKELEQRFLLAFSSCKAERLHFKVLHKSMKDSKNRKYMSGTGICWYHEFNLDFTLIRSLVHAERQNELVDDIILKNVVCEQDVILDSLIQSSVLHPEVPIEVYKANFFEEGEVLLLQLKDERFKNHPWYHKYVLLKVLGDTIITIELKKKIREFYFNVIGIYNWIGDFIPNETIISQLSLLQGEDFLGDIRDYMYHLDIQEKDLNNLNLKIILKDPKHKDRTNTTIINEKYVTSIHAGGIYQQIIYLLEQAQDQNILVDNIRNQ